MAYTLCVWTLCPSQRPFSSTLARTLPAALLTSRPSHSLLPPASVPIPQIAPPNGVPGSACADPAPVPRPDHAPMIAPAVLALRGPPRTTLTPGASAGPSPRTPTRQLVEHFVKQNAAWDEEKHARLSGGSVPASPLRKTSFRVSPRTQTGPAKHGPGVGFRTTPPRRAPAAAAGAADPGDSAGALRRVGSAGSLLSLRSLRLNVASTLRHGWLHRISQVQGLCWPFGGVTIKRMWCVADTHTLFCYKDETEEALLDAMQFRHALSFVRTVTREWDIRACDPAAHYFGIQWQPRADCPKTLDLFFTYDAAEYEAWVSFLSHAFRADRQWASMMANVVCISRCSVTLSVEGWGGAAQTQRRDNEETRHSKRAMQRRSVSSAAQQQFGY